MKLELTATATFGLEAVVRREIEALGYRVLRTEDGRVTYMGDERAVVRSNLWLRSADRVYIRMGEFRATEFEELFQQVKALEWERIIPVDGSFPVTGGSVKSALHSVPACQKIIKKAVSVRLADFYCLDQLPETGAEYRIRFISHKDSFLLLIDTSGAGLHKRGYRVRDVAAPMKETLAAALVQLSFYRADRILIDPCCGSGTIPIEAAMIARNIAPGLSRSFASEKWDMFEGGTLWKEERRLAFEAIDNAGFGKETVCRTQGGTAAPDCGSIEDQALRITAMDIDPRAVRAAKENAEEAGVSDDIDIVKMDMTAWKPGGGIPKGAGRDDHVIVISNFPYGRRIGDDAGIKAIYCHIRAVMEECPKWSFFLITSDKMLEKELGRRADRRRKLYNGTIETQFYQFHGQKPEREGRHE